MVGPDDHAGSRDGVRVRRVEPGDTEQIAALHRRALREAGTDPDDVPGTADLRWVEAAYLDTGGEFLVAELSGDSGGSDGGEAPDSDADRIVAMGGLVVDGDVGELFRLAVDPDAQRHGYGSAVLDGLETAARERGVSRLVLTTASRQESAVSFYRSRGYEEVDRRRHGEYELVRFARRLDA